MATPTDDTDYSCHTKAVELVEPIILGPNHATSCHITPLIIKALGTDTHTDITTKAIHLHGWLSQVQSHI